MKPSPENGSQCMYSCVSMWGCVHTCVIWVRGAPDGRNGRAASVSMCERRKRVLGSVKSFDCSGPVTEKCTHWTPLTQRNCKTLSRGYTYSPRLPLTHSLTLCICYRMLIVTNQHKTDLKIPWIWCKGRWRQCNTRTLKEIPRHA